MLGFPNVPFYRVHRDILQLCEQWSFSNNNQPNIRLNINCNLLLRPNSKTVLNFKYLTLWELEERNWLFKIMKNANVRHLEVGVQNGGLFSKRFLNLRTTHKIVKTAAFVFSLNVV